MSRRRMNRILWDIFSKLIRCICLSVTRRHSVYPKPCKSRNDGRHGSNEDTSIFIQSTSAFYTLDHRTKYLQKSIRWKNNQILRAFTKTDLTSLRFYILINYPYPLSLTNLHHPLQDFSISRHYYLFSNKWTIWNSLFTINLCVLSKQHIIVFRNYFTLGSYTLKFTV